ncbi:MAG: protein arginine kinase [Thermoguttaceae bacterium]
MKIDKMLSQLCEWLHVNGPENDIVISSRIRLARNISGFPFMVRATDHDRKAIRDMVFQAANRVFDEQSIWMVDVENLDVMDREYLLERQLISRELVETAGARAALIDKTETFCVMVNEEDHLRIHGMTNGFNPQKIWERINDIDDRLEQNLPFAFHEKLGYLTACPTNVGTGMRVSVMLHLPALVISKEIEKVFRSLQKINLAVRGLYGEGSQSFGDFYQISNQVTLGVSEEELIEKVAHIIPEIISYEKQAREFLLSDRQEVIQDRCSRAMGVLKTARTIGSAETLHHLSCVRLGVNMGILSGPDMETVNHLFLYTQPAHLQKLHGGEMPQSERDIIRAKYLREKLGGD